MSLLGGMYSRCIVAPGAERRCKERLLQIISVTTQVANSRRVHRYTLALRDHQAARGREEEAGGKRPMTGEWNVGEE